MKSRLLHGLWLLLRNLGVAGLWIAGFPLLIGGFYVIASITGPAGNSGGDPVTAILFSGAAFVIACLFALIMFPSMIASDLFRLFKGCGRWMSFLPGAVMANLILLPLQLNQADGFSLMDYLKGVVLFSLFIFGTYWGVCQVTDLLAAKLLSFVRSKSRALGITSSVAAP